MLAWVLDVVWLACAASACLSACMCGLARGGARVRSSAIDSVPTALFTSATSTAHIAPITATTVISPNNDNVLEQFGGVEANSLCRLLNTNLHHDHIADELDVMQLSSYYDDDSLNKLFKYKSDSFSILGLNCQC